MKICLANCGKYVNRSTFSHMGTLGNFINQQKKSKFIRNLYFTVRVALHCMFIFMGACIESFPKHLRQKNEKNGKIKNLFSITRVLGIFLLCQPFVCWEPPLAKMKTWGHFVSRVNPTHCDFWREFFKSLHVMAWKWMCCSEIIEKLVNKTPPNSGIGSSLLIC